MKTLTQPSLFDLPKTHRADPATSYLAAEKLAKSGGWTAQQAEVYEALKGCNGGTAGEIGATMPGNETANRYKVARRMPELREKGVANGNRSKSKSVRL